jgi:hypothetical protein
LPYATGLARVKKTFVPDTVTELTALAAEFTWTEKADAGGTILASVRLYVISTTAGAPFSTAEPANAGTAGGAEGLGSTIITAEE